MMIDLTRNELLRLIRNLSAVRFGLEASSMSHLKMDFIPHGVQGFIQFYCLRVL